MKNKIERRQDPRAPISLSVEIKTSKGTIQGKTANISIGGLALLLFSEPPDVGNEFQIILDFPEYYKADLKCKKRWSGEMIADSTVYTAIGVQFINISTKNREIIVSLVEEYCMT